MQEWILVKVQENKSLLMNNSKYKEHIEPDLFKKITEQKKYTFQLIEDLLKSKDEKNNNKIINEFFEQECKKGENK